MIKGLVSSLFASSALLFSGCTVLPEPAPADVIYRLGALPEVVPANDKASVIRVDRPSASIVFQTRDVIIAEGGGQRLSSAAQAKWADVMPVMIQQAFIDLLESRPRLIGVLPASGARTDTRVQIAIKNFEAQFDQGKSKAPLAVVEFTVTFAKASNRNLLGTYNVRKTQRASQASVSSIVSAISEANIAALTDIAEWLENQPAHNFDNQKS